MKREYNNISLPQPFFQLDLLSATDNYEKYSSVVCSPMFTNSFYWDNTLNMWIADTLNVPRSAQNYAAKCLSGDYTWSMESEGFTFLMDVYLITVPTGYRFNIDFIPRYGLNVYDTSEINYTFRSWHKYANVWSPPPPSTYSFREIFIDGVSVSGVQYAASLYGNSSGIGIQNNANYRDLVKYGIRNIKCYKKNLTIDEIRQIQEL